MSARRVARVLERELDHHLISTLPLRFLLGALFLALGLGVDLPWLEESPWAIAGLRGTMVAGCLALAWISRGCESRLQAEILVSAGVLGAVSGMALLGWIQGTYFSAYTASLYQVLAFVTIFLAIRTLVFLLLIAAVGAIWFMVFPAILSLPATPKVLFSQAASFSLYAILSLAGNYVILRLRTEEEDRRTSLEMKSQQLDDLSLRDALTGAYNYRHFQQSIPQLVRETERNNKYLSLCLVDLDGFGALNEEYGHAVGNSVLQSVAKTLISAVRQGDAVYRIGGDEFAISLPGASATGAKRYAERVRESLAGQALKVTCSFGIAQLSPQLSSAPALIEAAERAMIQAKKERGDRIVTAGRED